jgi:hypothetical protein
MVVLNAVAFAVVMVVRTSPSSIVSVEPAHILAGSRSS